MTGLLLVATLAFATPQAEDAAKAHELFYRALDRHAELDVDSSLVLLRAARDADLSNLPIHLEYIHTVISRIPTALTSLREDYDALPESPLIRCLKAYVAVSQENLPAAVPSLMEMEERGEGGDCPTVLLAGIVGDLRPARAWEGRRLEYLERAIALEPNLQSLWTSYASVLGNAGRIEEAEHVLRTAAAGAGVHPLHRISLNMRRAGLMRSRGDTVSANALWGAVRIAVQRDGRPGTMLTYLRESDSVLDTRNTAGNELDSALLQTADLAERHGAWVYEWYTRNSLAMRLTDRGEPLAAIPHYDRIVQIADSVKIASYQTPAYYKRGLALVRLGRVVEAESDLVRAVDLAAGAESEYFLAEAYHNLFHLYEDTDRVQEAAQAVDRFVQAVQVLRHSPLRMTALLDAGELYWKAGWHAAANDAFAAALVVVDEHDEYHNYAGEYLERTGELAGARAYYQRGIEATGKSAIDVRSRSFAGLTRVYLAMGQLDSAEVAARAHDEAITGDVDTPYLPEILALEGEFPEAIRVAEEWVQQRIAGGSTRATCVAYLQLAALLIRAGDPAGALPILERADGLAQQTSLVRELIEAARLRGLALAAVGDTAGGLKVLMEATDDALLHPTDLNVRQTHTALGNLLAASGRLDDALAAYDRAAEQVGTTAASLHVDFDRVRYRDQHLEPFDGAIEALLSVPGRELELLSWSARRKAAALPELDQALADGHARTASSSASLVLNKLGDGRALIDYLISGDRVLAVVGREGILSVHELPVSVDSVQSLTSKLLTPLVATSGGRIDLARVRFDYAAAHELYRVLWEPLLPALADADQVTIIPDGPLHRIPFAVLVRNSGAEGERAAGFGRRFVLDDYEISYTPSARYLAAADDSDRRPANKPVRILALTYNAPGGESEVRSIADAWPSGMVSTLFADEATESTVRQHEGSYDIVHYATHAVANDRDPLASFIRLAPDPTSDGQYHLNEIAGQTRDQELVILSGCETQTGDLYKSEGLMSLTRAFLASGVRAVVATQWPIGAATAELMGEFHARLAAGDSPATGLRSAQMKLRRNPATSHPFYWAGFVLHRRD